MSVKVKICGIRTIDAAKVAVAAGVDYLGLNFVPTSKRYISKQQAKEIVNVSAVNIPIVGIFQNENIDVVNNLIDEVGLDFAQLHGDEDMEYIKKIKTKVIKAFRLAANNTADDIIEEMKKYSVDYFLIDREVQGQGGIVDLEKAQVIAKNFPVFFAGGLNPENVAEIINTVKPFGVDVAGGIETNGIEDLNKIKEFIKNAKGAQL